jgi:(S)-3,5-dihydroxyphenylglycine transaminase
LLEASLREISYLDLNPLMNTPNLSVMNFLNEATLRYPEAVSFASGRPCEKFFCAEDALSEIIPAARRMVCGDAMSSAREINSLFQYGKTNGLIQESIKRLLKNDEGIDIPSESICVTVGCQEAMLVSAATICNPTRDVILIPEPAYIGMVGVAQTLGIETRGIKSDENGACLDDLQKNISLIRAGGKRPRALYATPDFSNPSGVCMSMTRRQLLLDLCYSENIFIFEDNAYGLYAFDEPRRLTLKAMDKFGCVLYLGSFAKSVYPGLRLGFVVADQKLEESSKKHFLADEISKVKSMTTVNTPSLSQIVLNEILTRSNYSLVELNDERRDYYKKNRDTLISTLEAAFREEAASGKIRWNIPSGGFFLVLTLPFVTGNEFLEKCALEAGVIWVPMSYFYLNGGGENQIRLSFSYIDNLLIAPAIWRLSELVKREMLVKNIRCD